MEPSDDARLVIKFDDDLVWIDADGEWRSNREALTQLVENWWNGPGGDSLEFAYYPNLYQRIADAAVAELGATVVSVAPLLDEDTKEGGIY